MNRGTGAAIALAYYSAAESPELEKTLEKTIILLDPSFSRRITPLFHMGKQ
jgi:hypothetical protein